MISFIKSFFFFLCLIFRKIEIDVIFYYPHHFNRGSDGENVSFFHLYQSCKNNNLTYLVFEEPDFYSSQPRGKDPIPFDFVYLLIIFLRRFIKSDRMIGEFLSFTFLRRLKFNNYVSLSQSMLSVFRGLNSEAKFFDLQHGVIWPSKSSYFYKGIVSNNLRENDVNLLLFGDGFQLIIKDSDKSNYLQSKSFVIGVPRIENNIEHTFLNNKILVSLQFTRDHTSFQNLKLAQELESYIKTYSNCTFYLRNHPRYNNEVDLSRFFKYNNVKKSNSSLMECIKICSIHLTSYSTTTFELAYFGIPTVFLISLSDEFTEFRTDFNYPLENDLLLIKKNYKEFSEKVKKWEGRFYTNFDEKRFISLLQ